MVQEAELGRPHLPLSSLTLISHVYKIRTEFVSGCLLIERLRRLLLLSNVLMSRRLQRYVAHISAILVRFLGRWKTLY